MASVRRQHLSESAHTILAPDTQSVNLPSCRDPQGHDALNRQSLLGYGRLFRFYVDLEGILLKGAR